MRFSRNTAVTASSVYLNNLNLCSWVEGAPWFEPSGVFNWTFIEFRSADFTVVNCNNMWKGVIPMLLDACTFSLLL